MPYIELNLSMNINDGITSYNIYLDEDDPISAGVHPNLRVNETFNISANVQGFDGAEWSLDVTIDGQQQSSLSGTIQNGESSDDDTYSA